MKSNIVYYMAILKERESCGKETCGKEACSKETRGKESCSGRDSSPCREEDIYPED